jgi:DUF1680 family protein
LFVNGTKVEAPLEEGFAVLDRDWHSGDNVELNLSMRVRTVKCHPAVEANRNRLAFTRGPLVLCGEGIDNAGNTEDVFVDELAGATSADISRISIRSGSFLQAIVAARTINGNGEAQNVKLVLTPYYAWNNRGNGSMTVWFPQHLEPVVRRN